MILTFQPLFRRLDSAQFHASNQTLFEREIDHVVQGCLLDITLIKVIWTGLTSHSEFNSNLNVTSWILNGQCFKSLSRPTLHQPMEKFGYDRLQWYQSVAFQTCQITIARCPLLLDRWPTVATPIVSTIQLILYFDN